MAEELESAFMPHPEMGYRACMGLRSLAKKFTTERLEAAATRAIRFGIHHYWRKS